MSSLQTKDIEILYVESDEFIRENMKELFKKLFKEVYVASNGREAIFEYNNHSKTVAIIVTDINTPELSGIDIARVINKMKERLGTKTEIIAVSAYSQEDYNFKEVTENFKYYIKKPIKIKDLLTNVERAVQQM